MQVMPATAQRYGVAADAKASIGKKLADPRINIKTGARYLHYLLGLFPGRLELALAAYNAGEGAVQRAGNRIPNYPETQNYVKTVMQLYTMLKPPSMGSAGGRTVKRIRMELPGVPGGAVGRGNLPPGAAAMPAAQACC
jgi:soluble lytic murein transglycosylase-like protein